VQRAPEIPGQRHANSFLSHLSAKRAVKYLRFKRFQVRLVTGLLTEACHSKGHIFKLGIAGRCNNETETTSHIACESDTLTEL
jgi:hypothetical protein